MATGMDIADMIRRMIDLDLHLVRLHRGVKAPVLLQWQNAPALTFDEALDHVARGGNLGINLRHSRLVVLDAENAAATQAVVEAGGVPTVIPAKSQVPPGHACAHKIGGSHTWLRVRDGIAAENLHTVLGIRLANGGIFDALAGSRQAVAPPSTLNEADGRRYVLAGGGVLDPAAGWSDIPEAPEWLFDTSYARKPTLLAAS